MAEEVAAADMEVEEVVAVNMVVEEEDTSSSQR